MSDIWYIIETVPSKEGPLATIAGNEMVVHGPFDDPDVAMDWAMSELSGDPPNIRLGRPCAECHMWRLAPCVDDKRDQRGEHHA
jgi:hypothetical protein